MNAGMHSRSAGCLSGWKVAAISDASELILSQALYSAVPRVLWVITDDLSTEP